MRTNTNLNVESVDKLTMRKRSLKIWRILATIAVFTLFLSAAMLLTTATNQVAQARSHQLGSVIVWIQVTDSCKRALPGATFTVSGPGINTTTLPTAGTEPSGLHSQQCPIQQGRCHRFSTGCTFTILIVPASGFYTYTITVAQTAPGRKQTGKAAYGDNWTYAICNGGSACSNPEVATVQVSSSGKVYATVLNTYPDGTTVTWPTTEKAYRGTQADPIMFHEFGVSKASGPMNQCDGDHDADDYLTGIPGQHCDSDGDKTSGAAAVSR
jgi:hypothetical protein